MNIVGRKGIPLLPYIRLQSLHLAPHIRPFHSLLIRLQYRQSKRCIPTDILLTDIRYQIGTLTQPVLDLLRGRKNLTDRFKCRCCQVGACIFHLVLRKLWDILQLAFDLELGTVPCDIIDGRHDSLFDDLTLDVILQHGRRWISFLVSFALGLNNVKDCWVNIIRSLWWGQVHWHGAFLVST